MPNHTGKSIAEAVYTVLDDYILIKKIGCITIDNASNNVKFFDILLENNGYQFSIQNKQIRCLCHVIQLVVNNFLEGFKIKSTTNWKTCWIQGKCSTKKHKNSAEFENIVEKVRSVVAQYDHLLNNKKNGLVCAHNATSNQKNCQSIAKHVGHLHSTCCDVQTQISVYSTTCQKNRYCISVSEWAKVKKLLDFLKFFWRLFNFLPIRECSHYLLFDRRLQSDEQCSRWIRHFKVTHCQQFGRCLRSQIDLKRLYLWLLPP